MGGSNQALVSLSSNLFQRGVTSKPFFDRDLVSILNRSMPDNHFFFTISVFDADDFGFHSLLLDDRRDEHPPYEEFVKIDRFKQYICDEIRRNRNSGLRMFLGKDFFPLNEYDREPYVQFLRTNYPHLDLKYCLKVPMGEEKNYWINIFKHSVNGDFSDNEYSLCYDFCTILESAYRSYEQLSSTAALQNSMEQYLDSLPGGVAFFDENRKPVRYCGEAKDLLRSVSGKARPDDGLHDLLNRFDNAADGSTAFPGSNLFVRMTPSNASRPIGYVEMHPAGQPSSDVLQKLTTRERDIVRGLASGMTYAQLAQSLYISIPTVRNHVTNIYRKLGIGNQRQLIALFYGNDIN